MSSAVQERCCCTAPRLLLFHLCEALLTPLLLTSGRAVTRARPRVLT